MVLDIAGVAAVDTAVAMALVEAARALRLLAGRMVGGSAPTPDAAAQHQRAEASVSIGLSELATSFPQRLPGGDGEVAVVALLAPALVEEPGLVDRWLAPRRIALAGLGEEVARALGTRFEVVAPSEIPRELAAGEQEMLRDFREDEAAVARMNDALGTDAVFVVRARPAKPDEQLPSAMHLDVRMEVGSDPLHVRRFANQTWIMDGMQRHVEWNPSALALASLLLVLAVLPFLRGWGELQVGIQYASLGKGFFSIKLSRKPSRAEVGEEKGKGRYLRKTRMMGRFERAMVGKETLFRWLPARRYYVTVHGLMEDPISGEVVGNYAAEQMVVIARGKQARLDFDFRVREATLEVSVLQGTEPLAQARVAIRGLPDSIRYTRGGPTLFYVAPGTYRVLIATETSVFEREVSIENFAPRAITQNVDDENALIFANCADAVEPYMTGNLPDAADALEQAGQDVAAANVRGEHFAAVGDKQSAARAFERAGRLEDAASLLSGESNSTSAAELFAQAGNHEKAAQAFEAAGDHRRAGAHYEAVYRYEDAVDCYRRVGDVEKVCELQEKLARYFEAAQAALETGDADRAIRNLQAIDVRDPDYVRACALLGQIFRERGEHDLALQKLDDAVTVGGGENAPLDLVEQLARAYEQAGRSQQALTAWEAIRARDFHYPEAASKIESLRQSVDADRETRATLSAGAFGSEESRYEILGEVGRGGMGVVFKARDKRLGRVVALKRLPDNLRNHPTAVRLFLREARAAAALNHRNIVTLFDAGQEGDQYFITMELLEGFPLSDILTKRGKLSARDAARLAVQACAGLEYAHASGVVHRDIKTSNLFFTKERVLKIMDFGLAKMTEEVRRAQTVIGGTPYYMAPEQGAGEDVDHRADQYALGVTLFELVTGDVPFRDGDVTHHHRHTPAPDPRIAAPDLPEDFARVILQLMAKRREDRFDKTADAGAAMQKIAKRLSS
jgi:tRNA A-37 threonylcarbamoyl transferase component Bud32